MYPQLKIDSPFELPFHLIEINTGNECFVLQFDAFDDNQDDYSVKISGIAGKFSISYESRGIHCDFGCDITVGNVYEFYAALTNAYDLLGKDSVAVLNDYSENRTNLTIHFDNKGHFLVNGMFMNADHWYQSGVTFSFEVDQTYITDSLHSMKRFFHELGGIQGHNTFY